MVFKQANVLFVFPLHPPMRVCWVPWLVCFFVSVCLGTRPPLNWVCRSFVCVCVHLQSLTFSHSLFSFPAYFPSLMSACFLLLFYSPSLSSHRDCVHSCQEGRRCLWSRLDKDQASPLRCPHPLPGKSVAPSLAGHQLLFECAASRGSGDLTWFVSLLLRVCPEPLAATPITKGLVSWYRSWVLGGGGGEREMSQWLNVEGFLFSFHHKKRKQIHQSNKLHILKLLWSE